MNARESVRFLDRVTSGKHSIPTSKVTLQGPMEQFESWEEAEKYLLPEFKEEVVAVQQPPAPVAPASVVPVEKPLETGVAKRLDDLNAMSQMLLSKLNFKRDVDIVSANSGGSPSLPTSPATTNSHPSPEYATRQLEGSQENGDISDDDGDDDGSQTMLVNPIVPEDIKPLLNAILWRLHAHPDASVAASGCILVTNNRSTQNWAQKFGITVKNVPQLRTSIIYEEKEFKNHCKYLEKNPTNNEPKPLLAYSDESDEDVLVFVPRGQAKPGAAAEVSNRRIPSKQVSSNKSIPVAPRAANGYTNGNHISSNISNVRGKVTPAVADPQVEVPSVPIDPDSFNRNFGVTKQSGMAAPVTTNNVSPVNNVNRGSPGHLPPRHGGRRGAPRGGGGVFRGAAGRGRGKLWVP